LLLERLLLVISAALRTLGIELSDKRGQVLEGTRLDVPTGDHLSLGHLPDLRTQHLRQLALTGDIDLLTLKVRRGVGVL
jgi:hypothetical protein